MTFLYYPTRFELIVEDALKQLGKNETQEFGRLCVGVDEAVPQFGYGDDDNLMRTFYLLKHPELAAMEQPETTKNCGIFGFFYRDIENAPFHMAKEYDDDNEPLNSVLLTQLYNDPRMIQEETFSVDVTEDFARFQYNGNKDKFSYEICLPETDELSVPNDIYNRSCTRNNGNIYTLATDEGLIRDVIARTCQIAFDYMVQHCTMMIDYCSPILIKNLMPPA